MVLKSLQENKTRNVVKDVKDTFGFKTAAKEKPLTCRGLLPTFSSVYNPLEIAASFILEGCITIQKPYKENMA